MSSEGSLTSSGSRIRQFGLYRTMDARTEEFLRSSRKRQIRQGCACAAISTAITVTVVVSVILVYEYSINLQSNGNKKILVKPNWFGLMNDSDMTSISSKFNKKINFDRTTLKLLPVLLKALNKNRYLEKIIEDYSSSSSPFTGKDSTEATFIRNVFSDSKNWLKMPTSRHYTVDYKTSPLVYWKTPTQRLEYLTKIRKIRDYQRVLNYFDKMINDKVGSNQKKEYEYTESPFKNKQQQNPVTVPMTKMDLRKNIQMNRPKEREKINIKEYRNDNKGSPIINCKCPKKLGQLLTKLISGIQDMIPHMISNKLGKHTTCNDNNTEIVQTLSQSSTTQRAATLKQRIFDLPLTVPISSTENSVFRWTEKFITPSPKLVKTTRKNRSRGTFSSTTSSFFSSISSSTMVSTSDSTIETSTLSSTVPTVASTTIMETSTTPTISTYESLFFEDKTDTRILHPWEQQLKKVSTSTPSYQTSNKNIEDYDFIVKTTSVSPSIKVSTPKQKYQTTDVFVPVKLIDSIRKISSTDKWIEAFTLESLHSRVPLYKEEEYDDYFVTKSTTTTNEYENLDVHGMELMKNKMFASNEDELRAEYNFKKTVGKLKLFADHHPVDKPRDIDFSSMRKLADMIFLPHEKVKKKWNDIVIPKFTLPTPLKKETDPTLTTESNISYSSEETSTPMTSNTFSSTLETTTASTPSLGPDKNIKHHEDTTTNAYQQTGETEPDEEFLEEETARTTESSTVSYKYKYKNTTRNANLNIKKVKHKPWESAKNEDAKTAKSPKSMIPYLRPIYLEVQRNNEWRQDDHADYDINFNNNIFDLPNMP